MLTQSVAPVYKAWFQSFAHDEERYPLDQIVYCDARGGLLQVVHDTNAMKATSAEKWKQLFQTRSGTHRWPYGSGVWRYKEWVLPMVEDRHIVSLHEGNTNLFWARRFGKSIGVDQLWVKLCGNSHTGSFKDLGMTVLISYVNQLRSQGRTIAAVACASTGDTSASLAAYAASAGIPAVVLLPRNKVSLAQLIQPLANGAIVFALDTDFDGCMALIKQLVSHDKLYLANSMNCVRIEGQKTLGIEIVEQFGWSVPDWIVIPGGNLGNVAALAKGLDLLYELQLVNRRPRICVAQAEAANPLYQSFLNGFQSFHPIVARQTLATAIQIGNPVSARKAIDAIRRYDGIVEQASEDELLKAAADADRAGLFNCPQTGVALAAAKKLRLRGVIKKDDRVVVISTANGLKFVDFKSQSVAANLPELTLRNAPIESSADYAAVRDRLLHEVERRQIVEA